MGNVINVVQADPAIRGNDAIIGEYYRRQSDYRKVYLCIRDTSRDEKCVDRNSAKFGQVIKHGKLLVSLAHGNPMTVNMHEKDFIKVKVVVEARDA